MNIAEKLQEKLSIEDIFSQLQTFDPKKQEQIIFEIEPGDIQADLLKSLNEFSFEVAIVKVQGGRRFLVTGESDHTNTRIDEVDNTLFGLPVEFSLHSHPKGKSSLPWSGDLEHSNIGEVYGLVASNRLMLYMVPEGSNQEAMLDYMELHFPDDFKKYMRFDKSINWAEICTAFYNEYPEFINFDEEAFLNILN